MEKFVILIVRKSSVQKRICPHLLSNSIQINWNYGLGNSIWKSPLIRINKVFFFQTISKERTRTQFFFIFLISVQLTFKNQWRVTIIVLFRRLKWYFGPPSEKVLLLKSIKVLSFIYLFLIINYLLSVFFLLSILIIKGNGEIKQWRSSLLLLIIEIWSIMRKL